MLFELIEINLLLNSNKYSSLFNASDRNTCFSSRGKSLSYFKSNFSPISKASSYCFNSIKHINNKFIAK